MKSFTSLRVLIAVIITVLLCAGYAFAAGKMVVDGNGRAIQAHSPAPAGGTCTTTTTTKGTIATATTAGYSNICWDAAGSNNAAIRIKRHLNSNTSYLPGTGDCFALNDAITSVVFKPYSGASAAYTVCYDRQSGGKTP